MFTPEELRKRSIPTIVLEDHTAGHFDPLSEISLTFEMMLRQLFDDSEEIVFGEPAQTKWLNAVLPTE